MDSALLEQIEARFAAPGRTPKGREKLRGIFRATHLLLTREGLHHTSLDKIAGHAGLSQAALRHYFPTREHLLSAYMVATSVWYRTEVGRLMAQSGVAPLVKLQRCVSWHLDYMESVDTTVWLENSAYWLRHRTTRDMRDSFYLWLNDSYARMIGEIKPHLAVADCRQRGMVVITLVLGAWITHGRGSAPGKPSEIARRRKWLLAAAVETATR